MSQTGCKTQRTSQSDAQIGRYTTAGGISVTRTEETLPSQGRDAIDALIGALDTQRLNSLIIFKCFFSNK